MTRPRPGDGEELDVFADQEEDSTLVDGEGGRGEEIILKRKCWGFESILFP